ncbi:MAG: DUF499 domain-containing protein [Defluviicoccus sp.]|nr:DUF499 domain-containing protein [Defluviicoccus sp.]MDE0276538.1 DUF499 domain-containing protein [Defluviicoccus sp.]
MSDTETTAAALAAKQRVEKAVEALRVGLGPYVGKHMRDRHGNHWRHHASRARGGEAGGELDAYALLKTVLDNWNDLFRHDEQLRRARSFLSIALDARHAVSHFAGELSAREALRYLDALREVAVAIGAAPQAGIIGRLYGQQTSAAEAPAGSEPAGLGLEEPPPPEHLRPWREVCEPHPDVLEARFSDAEFAANLALVDQGEGSEEYTDPAAFFRITYATEGLRRVLAATIARLAGEGGDPVIGLQTNFGGGKTHTMLALYHLAGAAEAGYRPEGLDGMAEIFKAAGVETLGSVNRAVFVGTHKGTAEAMHVEGGREIRTLWGYLAFRLGGWEAVETIADSEGAGTNPGSERLIPILRSAAPCLILMDEVVAFARQLRGIEYDAFHAFIQSLTEAAAAVDGAVIVGSLPESGAEVGHEQGRDALQRLEKIFGRVQSAWTPASGVETFEIVRRRLFQPLDETGEKVRDETVRAFRRLYREHGADFPPEVREAAYEEEMRRAYPMHPEVLRRFSGDWSVLDKFQRTRGILKIMANAIYALWSGESAAPLITPALLPFGDDKVRTALLEPLDRAFGPILQSEVDGNQSLTARIESRRSRLGRTKAARQAARAVFFATAPRAGTGAAGMTGTEIRLACAQPGDQIAIFGEALQEISERSAHLYRDGDSYWYSPRATLNKLAADRARDVNNEYADRRIVEILREDQRSRAGFPRVHAAPDNPTDIDDRRATALVVLPPSAGHDASAGSESPAAAMVREIIERRGSRQRRFRNALVFAAADSSTVETARENARRERAWQSILDDTDLMENQTGAQTRDARTQADRSRQALLQSVRSTWVHVLLPHPPDDANGGAGYTIRSARLTNRGGAKPVPEAVWDKVKSDGSVLDALGPDNLAKELAPIWPEERPHLTVEDIRDWFASYVYLPRLRDDAALDGALQKLVEDLAHPYAFAASFDEETGTYGDEVDGRALLPGTLGDGLLVRREAIPATPPDPQEAEESERPGGQEPDSSDPATPAPAVPRPKRFFASLPIDPERAGLEVARIMDGLLVELTRTPGSSIALTVEIQGSGGEDGYPEDVVEVVKANARDLKLNDDDLGFEEE